MGDGDDTTGEILIALAVSENNQPTEFTGQSNRREFTGPPNTLLRISGVRWAGITAEYSL